MKSKLREEEEQSGYNYGFLNGWYPFSKMAL